jgi:hypothetical protein
MNEQELAALDKLLDRNSPRLILMSLANLLEQRAAAVLDVPEPTTDETVRGPALLSRSSAREIRNFSIRV